MFDEFSEVAEKLATNVSCRAFLGRLGQGALGLAKEWVRFYLSAISPSFLGAHRPNIGFLLRSGDAAEASCCTKSIGRLRTPTNP